MTLDVSGNFRLIYEIIAEKSACEHLAHRHELKMLLQTLSPLERVLVARCFCKAAWNIGSLRILCLLQELGILSATEFVLSLQDTQQLHLILNDFLEAEFDLLNNLFSAAHYDTTNSTRLNALLDECLQHLFLDLIENPALSSLDYLKIAFSKLPSDLLLKIMQKHINIVVELHSSGPQDAFNNFAAWINEGVDDIKLTKDLYEKLIRQYEQEALSHLFRLSTAAHFKEWKFYLILLQTIASRCSNESAAFIRKYFKTRINQIAALPCKTAMLHLLLTARAATARTLDIEANISAYSDWYKQHISDMKFVLKTEEFQAVLSLLEQCIPYEMTDDYLEIHATISISPPVYCGKLVQTYRSKCKMRLADLKALQNKDSHKVESITVLDSDYVCKPPNSVYVHNTIQYNNT